MAEREHSQFVTLSYSGSAPRAADKPISGPAVLAHTGDINDPCSQFPLASIEGCQRIVIHRDILSAYKRGILPARTLPIIGEERPPIKDDRSLKWYM